LDGRYNVPFYVYEKLQRENRMAPHVEIKNNSSHKPIKYNTTRRVGVILLSTPQNKILFYE